MALFVRRSHGVVLHGRACKPAACSEISFFTGGGEALLPSWAGGARFPLGSRGACFAARARGEGGAAEEVGRRGVEADAEARMGLNWLA